MSERDTCATTCLSAVKEVISDTLSLFMAASL